MSLPWNKRKELTSFEDEAKKIYCIFEKTDIIIKNPLMSYTEEKIKFYTNTNKLNADGITKSENQEGLRNL